MPIGNMLWESVKAAGGILGHAAKETGLKGKLQTELLLISREIDGRKRAFGEELYDFVVRSCRFFVVTGEWRLEGAKRLSWTCEKQCFLGGHRNFVALCLVTHLCARISRRWCNRRSRSRKAPTFSPPTTV